MSEVKGFDLFEHVSHEFPAPLNTEDLARAIIYTASAFDEYIARGADITVQDEINTQHKLEERWKNEYLLGLHGDLPQSVLESTFERANRLCPTGNYHSILEAFTELIEFVREVSTAIIADHEAKEIEDARYNRWRY